MEYCSTNQLLTVTLVSTNDVTVTLFSTNDVTVTLVSTNDVTVTLVSTYDVTRVILVNLIKPNASASQTDEPKNFNETATRISFPFRSVRNFLGENQRSLCVATLLRLMLIEQSSFRG
jgi:hypothetical protein